MDLVREVFRLKFENKMSNRAISVALNISKTTVSAYLTRANIFGITTYSQIQTLSDDELKVKIFSASIVGDKKQLSKIDFTYIHKELKRKHVTLKLLWKEAAVKDSSFSISYSQYCRYYHNWQKNNQLSMKQVHKAGEKTFIDYAGTTIPVVNAKTGEINEAQIFVAALGCSQYTYIEATWTQSSKDFLNSNIHAFEYFGGCSEILVPDNLKSGVTKACRYEPSINKSYRELAKHYGAVVIPARVRKPKDKAIVEGSVLIASRWIIAALRDRIFFTLDELNTAIWELLDNYNNQAFQKREGSRQSIFEGIERETLKKLPSSRFEIADWKNVKANIDYHIEVEHCYYSVPFKLRGKEMQAHYSDNSVEIFSNGQRVAIHPRLHRKGQTSTIKEHMPKGHQDYGDWKPSRIINWANTLGPDVKNAIEFLLNGREHPQLSYRSCLGIIRLEKYYSKERLNNACKRAIEIGGVSFKSIKSILEKGLDSQPILKNGDEKIEHENIRGAEYFQ